MYLSNTLGFREPNVINLVNWIKIINIEIQLKMKIIW